MREKRANFKNKQSKIVYAEKNKGKTLKTNKIVENLTRRMTRSQKKLHILAQVAVEIGK